MEGRVASKTRIYLLRLTHESDGSIRAVLRVRGDEKEHYFANLEALLQYLRGLEAEFKPRGIR
jgi:hypothetical protein